MPPTPTSDTARPVAQDGDLALFVHAGELRGGMSRAEAARLVGIRSDDLAKIERGETSQVRWVTLLKLMRAYGCSLSDLVEVRSDWTQGEPAYAKALAAIRAGQLTAGPPRRRYSADRDLDDAAGQLPSLEVAELFGESTPRRGRKAPFRPTSKQPA
jgi:DNA-binding Xre family transcriptional regulator